jgi:S-adenosylmethionine hydrolase
VLIALITDFGHRDSYVGVMKGVIRSENPDVEIIDITHSIESFSILEAQYVLYSSVRYFPAGSVFCVVVDPGVGSSRRCLAATAGRYSFVLPDNGVLSAVESPELRVHAIDETAFQFVSSTFHGRDVFAPVAARISGGTALDSFGPHIDDWERKQFAPYESDGGVHAGAILHVDRFGNVITSIPSRSLDRRWGAVITVEIGSARFRARTCRTFYDLADQALGVLPGSSGFLEIVMNRYSAAKATQSVTGATIRMEYE